MFSLDSIIVILCNGFLIFMLFFYYLAVILFNELNKSFSWKELAEKNLPSLKGETLLKEIFSVKPKNRNKN